jgi:hypothetical protein
MADLEDSVRKFCDDDVKILIRSQAEITANLALASTNLAVASNNIDWIVKTYSTEYKKMTDLQLEVAEIKGTLLKYIGIGTGVSIAVSFVVTLLTLYIKLSGT